MFRIMLLLFTSLILAFLLGLSLYQVGILEVHSEKVQGLATYIAQHVSLKEVKEKQNAVSKPQNQDASQKAHKKSIKETSADTHKSSEKHRGTQAQKIIDFLSSIAGQQQMNHEKRLARFLRQDLSMNRQEIRRTLKRCFWKGFVTLQQEWKSEEKVALQRLFQTELALKKAGFKAKGLKLLQQDIDAAKAKLQAGFNSEASIAQSRGDRS